METLHSLLELAQNLLVGLNLFDLFQILLIDITLAGDNAIAVGLAAAGLPAAQRRQAIISGIVAATVMRIIFAFFAVQLLEITGLLAAGGLLLLWVAWKMYHEVRLAAKGHAKATKTKPPVKKLSSAILQILAADVSMSLDNVLAVAGVARDHLFTLVIGLVLSVVLMGAASTVVAKLTNRYPWLVYLGIAIVLYAALQMIWDGGHDLLKNVQPALA
ncbi:MAG: YjbE family putative metal transport protein [Alphaproteobacteria bacterium]|nr:YjbE family putative metal transport protein [Alphaproteobacteria bacterium]